MTATEYIATQRAQAEQLAPPDSIDEAEFRYRSGFYTLATLRLASGRYSPCRGRNRTQVLARFVEAIKNPHVNQGDDFRLALGHIEATRRWMVERGLR